MGKLISFTLTSLNGYYKNLSGTIAWHQHGAEETEYSAASLEAGNTLLFGRVTYEEMAVYWSSQAAFDQAPIIAERMNKAEKIVFSTTLDTPIWHNTRVIGNNIVEQVKTLKQTSAADMTLLGSGSVVRQFAEAGLIDEYQLMIDPVAIGGGATLFAGLKRDLHLTLTHVKPFDSGVILAFYEPRNAESMGSVKTNDN